MSKATPAADRVFVPYHQLQDVLGFKYHRVHLNRLIAAGRFSTPRRLSDNRIAWLHKDLIAWAEARQPVRKGGRPRVRLEDDDKADRFAREQEGRA